MNEVKQLRKDLCDTVQKSERLGMELHNAKKRLEEVRNEGAHLNAQMRKMMEKARQRADHVGKMAAQLYELEKNTALVLNDFIPAFAGNSAQARPPDTLVDPKMLFVEKSNQAKALLKDAAKTLDLVENSLGEQSKQIGTRTQVTDPTLVALAKSQCVPDIVGSEDSSLQSALDRALDMGEGKLQIQQKSSEKGEENIKAVEKTLNIAKEHYRAVKDELEKAWHLGEESINQAANVATHVLSRVLGAACNSAQHVKQLRDRHRILKRQADTLKHELFNASKSIKVLWQDAKSLVGVQQAMEEALNLTLKEITELDQGLEQQKERSEAVAREFEGSVNSAGGTITYGSDTTDNSVRSIPLNLTNLPFASFCNANDNATLGNGLGATKVALTKRMSELVKVTEIVSRVTHATTMSEKDTTVLVSKAEEQRQKVVETVRKTRELATKIAQEQTRRKAKAFAQALESIIISFCRFAKRIIAANLQKDKLAEEVATLKINPSAESRIAGQAWEAETKPQEIPQEVGDSFTYASVHVKLFEKRLHQTTALYQAVVKEFGEGLKKAAGNSMARYITVADFMRDINSNLTTLSSPSVCTSNRINEIVTSLLRQSETTLENVSVLDNLRKFTAKIDEQVKVIKRKMAKVASSAADAQAAVEEAVRRARNAAAGRRCTPLHRQLLNVLQHIW
ncbi:hypothetical protein, conserved in T. vivax [Trypanosoma vivax Y486]|uniref:Uncharacterized protein n=1 Tax=Trypanosoma vivax (strain Y486) TaxID=1055687 RepID=F9WUH3_TRYVY|nr:hypothetical protein, conserved in T. vivax [Trypanosoma vivax Y486]|eukprot:CCD21222.1 hypothetical protein, conserved in T. vivax [Trypanosoma vivax Y486]